MRVATSMTHVAFVRLEGAGRGARSAWGGMLHIPAEAG